MAAFIDISGQVFGRLTALRLDDKKSPSGYLMWVCSCSCGSVGSYIGSNLRNGHTTSCGCHKRETTQKSNTKHGWARRCGGKSSEYYIYHHIISRCTNPRNAAYNRYGGRGITVCDAWLNSFEAFIADMGERPSDRHSIERVDNNFGYDKNNCVWATDTEQSRNKRNNLILTFRGESMCLAEWCEKLDLDYATVNARVSAHGWSTEKALTTPTNRGYRTYSATRAHLRAT